MTAPDLSSEVNVRAAAILTDGILNGVTHPGKPDEQPASLLLGTYRTRGMPPQYREAVEKVAATIAEGLIHTLNKNGLAITETSSQ